MLRHARLFEFFIYNCDHFHAQSHRTDGASRTTHSTRSTVTQNMSRLVIELPRPRARPKKWPQWELFHFAFAARRLPSDEGALLWGRAQVSSHGLSQMIASPHGHSRHVSPRRARGRLQAPIRVYTHPPSFPLISCRSIASATHSAKPFCSPSPRPSRRFTRGSGRWPSALHLRGIWYTRSSGNWEACNPYSQVKRRGKGCLSFAW